MPKINVLLLVEDLKIGGIERIVATIAEYLNRGKYNVFVWCLARGGDTAKELQDKGIDVEILNMGEHGSFLFLIRLFRMMKQTKIDILHSHGYTATTVGRLAAIFAQVPIILTHMHTSLEKYTKRQILMERILNIFTDKVICCSQAVAKTAKKFSKLGEDKIVVIYNGVDKSSFLENIDTDKVRQEFGILPEVRVIGCVASLSPHKGHHYLLEAAKIITESKLPKELMPKFLLVGDGSLRKDLEEHAQRLGIGDKFIFAGIRKDIFRILSIMDVVVLPSSQWEGLGVSLIEAMACERPVIGTNIGGIPEVIKDKETGILVESRNAHALAEAIISMLLNNKEKLIKMGLHAKKLYTEKFTSKIMLQKIEELYSSLMDSKRKKCAG